MLIVGQFCGRAIHCETGCWRTFCITGVEWCAEECEEGFGHEDGGYGV